MATPSLKTRTGWCPSLMSSERTTPPSRGPTSGEPPALRSANREPQEPLLLAIFEAQQGVWGGCDRVPLALRGLGRTLITNGQKSVFEKGRRRKKQKQGTVHVVFTIGCSCVSSRHDEHCAFSAVCGLKFFTVPAQFVGAYVSSLLEILQLYKNHAPKTLLL